MYKCNAKLKRADKTQTFIKYCIICPVHVVLRHLSDTFNFINKRCLDCSQLRVKRSLLSSLIMVSSKKEHSLSWTMTGCIEMDSSPRANSCVLVSLSYQQFEKTIARSLSVNGESVPCCCRIFSLSWQKDKRFSMMVLLNRHLVWGADVLWHGSADGCLFG